MFEREEREGVVVLRLAHGRGNALDLEFLRGITREMCELAHAPAMVLTGREGIFSAGVDLVRLRDGGADYVREFLPALDEAFDALFEFEGPVVAAINGHAIAGGCVLACACDVRVMGEGSGRIGVPELRVGVPFPPAALELIRRVAPGHVEEIVLRGETYTAQEGLERGLVDEVVPSEEVLDRAVAVAAELARVPRSAFAISKRALRAPTSERIARYRAQTGAEQLRAWSSPEVLGAVDAYVRAVLRK
ncbi:enoyl-CoA hydratase/isomerase family protein [Engelhardtia mirabilis]|uniref:2,3-dehydroadipyl-CoA hydratase n=1 Tax=Engelhardtia mirabilis TaxID=2528011 RepID=A0A518BPV9_9BACT|nr:2,3-dehydroadipyl-CoA hydratase [Planctomycetes bacterium Pla133]QDV03337.1 2,3-dehydroadipyl-CoA hydratase [Planctomycetes bacterium Pla86]